MKAIQPKTIAEQLLYSTVRICGDIGTGTGFFFRFKINESLYIELILTNKHVVEGNKKLNLYFHEAEFEKNEVTNRSFLVEIQDFKNIWITHPDEDVDLGALLFVPIRTHAKKFMKKDIFAIFFDENFIKDDSFLKLESDVADEVLMVGYPIGLWDDCNNFPIIRKGITASHPALDFQGKSVGIVDIACFPGSSGSPIFIHMNGYQDKKGNYLIGASKNILLGLLFSGPIHKSTGDIEIQEIPTKAVPIVSTNQMIHLGYYVKAREILILCNIIKRSHDDLKKL